MAIDHLCFVLFTILPFATTQFILPRNMIGNEMAASEETMRILAMQNDETLMNAVHLTAAQHLAGTPDLELKIDERPNTTVSTTVPANTTVLPLIPLTYYASHACINDTMQFLSDAINKKSYAIKMFDSIGKLPSGVLEGNTQWIGASGECRNVKDIQIREHIINGKYCQASVPLGQGTLGPTYLQIGLCVPDTCNNLDVLTMINTGVKLIPVPGLQGLYVNCIEEYPLSAGAIVMIVIISILLAIMVAGTTYDVIINYIYRKPDDYLPHNIQNDETSPLLKDSSKSKQVSYQPGTLGECLLAFSVLINGGKILDATHSSGTLAAIHGIRVLSMWWVILGHSFITAFTLSDNSLVYIQDILPRFSFQAISNATFSVDTFFFLSGLLVTYLTLRELTEGRKVNWFMFYFHRFWRLTPVYLFLIFFVTYLFPYFGTGPYTEVIRDAPNPCEDYWWTNVLYINNLVPWPGSMQTMCYPVSWYLANDMQFHVISPLIIILLYKKPRIGYIALSILMAVCLASRVGIAINKDITSAFLPPAGTANSTTPNTAASDYYYTKPWTRISTYLVGMIVGYILLKTKCKLKINKFINLLCWAVAWVIALAVLYGLYGTFHNHPLSRPTDVFYMTVSRLAWSVAIGWLTFACLTGNGGPINAILSWKAWIPISRLTYCAYLTHIYVLQAYVMYQDRLVNLSDINQIYLYVCSLVLSYLISFVVSLMAEAPMMRLEKILLKKFKRT
ncbi:nose resistant to fluoxetine protein 6-like [Glandiceps talaboti]